MPNSEMIIEEVHPLVNQIIEKQEASPDNVFYRQAEKHLISLLLLYKWEELHNAPLSTVIRELNTLLASMETVDDLRKLPSLIAEDDICVEKLWEVKTLFSTTKGWEEQDNEQLFLTFQNAKDKLTILDSQENMTMNQPE